MNADGKTVSYFRGRKLYGRTVKIPKGYKGVILSSTDEKLPKDPQSSEEEELDENEQIEDIGILQEQAEFDEILVWGHETLPDETSDPYVRGVEEWIFFAEQVGSDTILQLDADGSRSIRTMERAARVTRTRRSLDAYNFHFEEHSAALVSGLVNT
jgi:hypothetical protein